MNKTIFNLFAALAFIFAALATPSASAYVAVVGGDANFLGTPLFVGIGDTRTDALTNARNSCSSTVADDATTNNANIAADFDCDRYEYFVSAIDDKAVCIGFSIHGVRDFSIGIPVYAATITAASLTEADQETAQNTAINQARTDCGSGCSNSSGVQLPGVDFTPNGLSGICDTIGLVCEDDELPNIADSSCGECPSTHEILNGICVEACTANQILVDRACQTCEDNETANKTLQRCEEICSDRQIRNPADTATCFTCAPNQFVNTEANNGNGSCDACPTDSHVLIDIGGEETCIMREICDADSLPTPQGTCNQCSAGYTANAEKDECVCVANSITDVGGNCMPCLAAVAPIADKEKNECVAATTQAECQSNFVATPIMEGGLCIAIASSLHCDLVDSTKPILDNGSCRAADSRDCPADKPVYDGGNCRIRLARDCGNGETFQNGNCIAPEQDTVNNRAIVIGLIMVGAFVADSWSDDAKSELNWTPSYAFRNNNGNVSYSVGSRWTAKTENFGYYWQTTSSGGGDYRYGSGMSYTNNLFAANINSEGNREDTDVNLSITANKRMGQWNFGGGYRIDSRFTPTESNTRNRLNLTARYTIERWILSATANTTGKDSAARVDYSYRF